MNIWFLFFIFSFYSSMQAGVLDHLKKAEGKLEIHKMKNIDFIYMINLDERPEKFENSVNQLYPYGIYPYRFSAVNGWTLSLEQINDIGVKFALGMKGGFWGTTYLPDGNFEPHHEIIKQYGRNYFCHCLSRGAMGCSLSHLSVLKDAYDSNYETIWVMEDDISVEEDPRILSDLITELDKTVGKDGWDILFTDRDTKGGNGKYVPCTQAAKRPNFTPKDHKRFSMNKRVSNKFRQIGARYGTYSMIIRRSGIKKFLNFYQNHQLFLPYDMDNSLPEGIRIFTVLKDVVSFQVGSPSDNGGANYLNK